MSKSKIALITGASKGIGRAIAIKLAGLGYSLALVGRNKESLEETQNLLPRNTASSIFTADFENPVEVEKVCTDFKEKYGELHILVNNHGVHFREKIENISDDQALRLIDVNLRASIQLTTLLLNHMLRSDPSETKAIIYISSLVVKTPAVLSAAYVASKMGLLGFANTLFEEIRGRDIKVSTICPGYVDTEQTSRDEKLKLDTTKMLVSQDVADAVEYVVLTKANCCPSEIMLRPQHMPVLR